MLGVWDGVWLGDPVCVAVVEDEAPNVSDAVAVAVAVAASVSEADDVGDEELAVLGEREAY